MLDFFRLEKGIHITSADSFAGITILKAATVPSATTDEDAAERGSFLFAEDGGGVFYKDTAGAGTNKWVKITDNAYLASVLGITEDALNFGTFTGALLTDNQSAKQLFQILETEVESLRTLSGTAAGADDLGAFTGTTIPDNSTIKAALQSLETFAESIGSEVFESSNTAITTIEVLDSLLVDDFQAAKWFLVVSLDSAPAQKMAYEVYALNDGEVAADATEIDYNVTSKLKVGASFNCEISLTLSGAGVTQAMELSITASAAVTAKAVRLSVA